MNVGVEMIDDVAVLMPQGSLVTSKTEAFQAQITALVAKDVRYLLLDMSDINFMDSSGLIFIMTLNRQFIDKGGMLVCAAAQDHVLKVFRVTWADHRVLVAKDRAEALSLLKKHQEITRR